VRFARLLPILGLACLPSGGEREAADLLLLNARVYTFMWDDPATDGTPAPNAPFGNEGWHPDAEAVAIIDGRIAFVGSDDDAEAYRAPHTWVRDLHGATVLPGLVDSHTHVAGLGRNLGEVSLVGIETEQQAIARLTELRSGVEPDEWIVGYGWDEGAWANRYPTMNRLSRAFPHNPVVLRSLHGFATWGNRMAFALAGIDRPGHKGVSGGEYGFDQEIVAEMIGAGFQVGIHAIGDAGNRESLDFLERVFAEHPDAIDGRHRIEHAQVVHPDDFKRFGDLRLIASMEPPHAVEDKAWAEARIGSERMNGAYAWRTMRRHNVPLIFNSDLTGSDHSIFYGLHAAITRRDKRLEPVGGWHPEQAVTPEEAIRAYTAWAAYAAFVEAEAGALEVGRWADITVMDVGPLRLGISEPDRLLDGSILLTIVAGEVVYDRP